MLPPPSTTTILTPAWTASPTSLARRLTTAMSMPNAPRPLMASPESFRHTRLYRSEFTSLILPAFLRRHVCYDPRHMFRGSFECAELKPHDRTRAQHACNPVWSITDPCEPPLRSFARRGRRSDSPLKDQGQVPEPSGLHGLGCQPRQIANESPHTLQALLGLIPVGLVHEPVVRLQLHLSS